MTGLDPSFIADLRSANLLQDGHFAFRSGRHTAGLVDRDRLLADPGSASHLGYILAKQFFSEHIDTVATPSIWGAGLAQWIGYFLEPRAKVVYATPSKGGVSISPNLTAEITGRRVLLVDNLVMSGETMTAFAKMIDGMDATVVGVATLWNLAEPEIELHPVTSVLNAVFPAVRADACPLCRAGGAEPVAIPY